MGVSAVDIITYIGIPLAVLGVLPTIYTVLKSYLTLRQISKTLQRNGVNAITRSSLLSGIVEIEIPRLSIAPLERNDPKYFGMRQKKSELKGGSWTTFFWREMVVGQRGYRVTYHDEVAMPQAEIEFEALVAFLLDRGAVPVREGWANLRGAGLWTPAGTRLLVAPVVGGRGARMGSGFSKMSNVYGGGHGALGEMERLVREQEVVLSVAVSDDSDGILSLRLDWKKGWDRRGKDDLPPYWIRVGGIGRRAERNGVEIDLLKALDEKEEKKEDNEEETGESSNKEKKNVEAGFLDDSAASEKEPSLNLGHTPFPSPIRLRIGPAGIQEAYREDEPTKKLSLPHLCSPSPGPSHFPIGMLDRSATPEPNTTAAGFWFCIVATAYETLQAHEAATSSSAESSSSSSTPNTSTSIRGLWSFTPPPDILALARTTTIPCGVLVLLQLALDSSVPTWRSHSAEISLKAEQFEKHVKFMEQGQAMMEEMKLPPDERQRRVRQRLERNAREWQNDMRRKAIRDEERKEAEMREALGSVGVGIGVVGSAAVKWLAKDLGLDVGLPTAVVVAEKIEGAEEEVGVAIAPSKSELKPPNAADDETTTTALLRPFLSAILAALLHSPTFATRLSNMLELWKSWAAGSGMTQAHFKAVQEDRIAFCLAAVVLWGVRCMVSEPMGWSVASDLQECLAIWKRVRLG